MPGDSGDSPVRRQADTDTSVCHSALILNLALADTLGVSLVQGVASSIVHFKCQYFTTLLPVFFWRACLNYRREPGPLKQTKSASFSAGIWHLHYASLNKRASNLRFKCITLTGIQKIKDCLVPPWACDWLDHNPDCLGLACNWSLCPGCMVLQWWAGQLDSRWTVTWVA